MPDPSEPMTSDAQLSSVEIVLITGMSGAGRSEAIHTFEDLGYFCIDNLPPGFIPQLTALAQLPESRISRLAVVSDVRAAEFFDQLAGEIDRLGDLGIQHRVIFLEADDDTLLNRFKATRRRHPLCDDNMSISEGIAIERRALEPIRARADMVVDTSDLRPAELRRRLREEFASESMTETLTVNVSSFGFKYGPPADADIIMDVRFIPNPYYEDRLRALTGLDDDVRDYVMAQQATGEFLAGWLPLLDSLIPHFIAEGKNHLSIALGCTGGRHRSVALAETTGAHLRMGGYRVGVSHRDIDRDSFA